MSIPEDRSRLIETLLVEVESAPGSGHFVVDDRLRAEEVTLGCDDTISTAKISVKLDNDFDTADARMKYRGDCRVAVRTAAVDPAESEVLFEGYPPNQEAGWDAYPRRVSRVFGFVARHVYERLSKDIRSQVYGRQMRNGAICEGLIDDPENFAGKSVLIDALPCIFNPNGVPNCDPVPLQITLDDGSVRRLYVFTYDDDPQAIPWTYLNALRYLFRFYAPREGPVGEGNLYSSTDVYVEVSPEEAMADASLPPLAGSLLRAADSLVCEAVNLVEAMALVARRAAVHVTPETVNEDGRVSTRLRIWSPSEADVKYLSLARGGRYADGSPRYDVSEKSAVEVLADNNVHRAGFGFDASRIVNAPIVIGDVKEYEMTVPLVPGWLPESNLDNVAPVDRAAAKASAMTPAEIAAAGDEASEDEFFKKYHRQGEDFKFNLHVARLWVLNEDGRYDSSYERNAPFDEYQPFDFSQVADVSVTTRGAWTRRSRRLRQPITKTAEGQEFGVWVEISFDGGATWYQQTGGVRVLPDQVGIYFEVDIPTAVTPPEVDPETQNLWYAIIDQTCRVRATGVIESDERIAFRFPAGQARSPLLQVNSSITRRPDLFQFASRTGTTDVLAQVNPEATDIGRDDTSSAEDLARRLAWQFQDRRVEGAPAIPWLETGYVIGDRIAGVRGQGLSFATQVGDEAEYPAVVGVKWRLAGGRYETELALEFTDLDR